MNALLIVVLMVPALGAAITALLPDRAGRVAATVAAAITFALTVVLALPRTGAWFAYVGTDRESLVPWREVNVSWIPSLEVDFHLAVDGISAMAVKGAQVRTIGYSVGGVAPLSEESVAKFIARADIAERVSNISQGSL